MGINRCCHCQPGDTSSPAAHHWQQDSHQPPPQTPAVKCPQLSVSSRVKSFGERHFRRFIMTRSSNGVWITLISLFGLTAMCGGAAPPATQPGDALLEAENRALRNKLMDLNNRNLNLEIEIAKLKAQ